MSKEIVPQEVLGSKIFYIRGHKVMLDQDLAKLYGVETKALNRAIRRNPGRFPEDFMFKLTRPEYTEILRCRIGTLRHGKHSKLDITSRPDTTLSGWSAGLLAGKGGLCAKIRERALPCREQLSGC